jgi:response regulator of citrate/malate metabolism
MLEVIKTIDRRGNTATANEISKDSKISYVTVQKYLKELEQMNIIILDKKSDKVTGQKSKIIRYSLNYKYLNSKDVD